MAELVGGALLSAVLDPLVEKLASEVVGFFKGKGEIVKLVKELKAHLSQVDLLLIDAEEKLIRDKRVKNWLDDVKDTIYAADDLVYKIDTEALRNQLEGESDQSSCTCKVLLKLISTTPLTAFDKAIKPEIEEILAKLKLLLENKDLGLKLIKKQKLPERIVAPLVDESDVYGRDDDKEAIFKLLLSDNDASGNKFCVIPIVGMGGMGKTTLAQLVYDDERANKRFDTKVWVTVGDDDKVDCLRVMKIIIQKVTKSEKCEIEDQFELLHKLKNVLTGKKFLIVLDDVWDEDHNRWDVLKNSFKSGLQGSKILVTTRSNIVASVMETGSVHHLKGVSYDNGWLLFAKHALIDASSNDYLDLQVIGRKIVDKCKGLPLAIKSLASLLRGKRTKVEWNDILNSDIWELYEKSNIGTLPALWLSYYYLPSELKPCFAYCALFPKDHEFKKEKIILLWIAEGLLHPKNGKRMKEVGEEYFQDLISRSFFQPTNWWDSNYFMMHDLMHDLAIFVSGEFCLAMDDTKFFNCTNKIRHLAYKGRADDAEKFESLSKAKGLRTFLTFPESEWGESWSRKMGNLFESLSHGKNCLRVLSVAEEYGIITRIPDSIGDLKYLKYLEINCIGIEEIPNSICNLYNLETLILEGCSNFKRLPVDIGNLINLRHLLIPCYLEEMPLEIGTMKELQTLNGFVVGECSIKHLKELRDLHGTLEIRKLDNVGSVEDVLEAELKNKKFLKELTLSWSFNCPEPDDLQKESEILGALEPHANLKKLCIHNYRGSSFPNWIGNPSLSNLVKVRLEDWTKCSFLPPLGQLPSLKHLFIRNFDGVKTIGSEFYYSSGVVKTTPFRSLETLYLGNMSELQEWSFVEGQVFPRLQDLSLLACLKLKVSLPASLPSLRELYIDDCDQLLPLVPVRDQQAVDDAFPSLESLKISLCYGQDSILKGGLPSSLKKIVIYNCSNLEALVEETFQHLTSLEKLDIEECPNLWCLPKELPTSLSHLRIRNCDLLRPRLKRETGDDWPIIAHIPNREITPDPDDNTYDEDEDSEYLDDEDEDSN